MMHRIKKRKDMHAGKWNGLGGKLEPGETPEECVIREVREECGLSIVRPILKGVLTFPAFSGGEDWLTFVFVAVDFSGTLSESSEGVLAWIEDERLYSLELWEGDRIFLRWLEQDDFFSAKFVYINGELANHDVVFYTRDRGAMSNGDLAPLGSAVYASASRAIEPGTVAQCWLCDGPVARRHCKLICLTCGFTRDCSDL
jgi:8-oxo-dGTP diphosphatase